MAKTDSMENHCRSAVSYPKLCAIGNNKPAEGMHRFTSFEPRKLSENPIRMHYQTNLPKDIRYFRSSESSERYILRVLELDRAVINAG